MDRKEPAKIRRMVVADDEMQSERMNKLNGF
jgi:hypothetical protein